MIFLTFFPDNLGGIALAASFKILFVVYEWAKAVILNHFSLNLQFYQG